MFASISKLVDKPFVIGFIIPVLLGTFSILALERDLEPFKEIYKTVMGLKAFADLTVVVLSLWVLATLLLLFNTLLFRLLEGYLGPLASARWRARMMDRYSAAQRPLLAKYQAFVESAAPASPEAKRAYYDGIILFNQNWPSSRQLVLPTRFGNVIRASETYS
jgi:hypothetical protein